MDNYFHVLIYVGFLVGTIYFLNLLIHTIMMFPSYEVRKRLYEIEEMPSVWDRVEALKSLNINSIYLKYSPFWPSTWFGWKPIFQKDY